MRLITLERLLPSALEYQHWNWEAFHAPSHLHELNPPDCVWLQQQNLFNSK